MVEIPFSGRRVKLPRSSVSFCFVLDYAFPWGLCAVFPVGSQRLLKTLSSFTDHEPEPMSASFRTQC